jgi:hypothetical protein
MLCGTLCQHAAASAGLRRQPRPPQPKALSDNATRLPAAAGWGAGRSTQLLLGQQQSLTTSCACQAHPNPGHTHRPATHIIQHAHPGRNTVAASLDTPHTQEHTKPFAAAAIEGEHCVWRVCAACVRGPRRVPHTTHTAQGTGCTHARACTCCGAQREQQQPHGVAPTHNTQACAGTRKTAAALLVASVPWPTSCLQGWGQPRSCRCQPDDDALTHAVALLSACCYFKQATHTSHAGTCCCPASTEAWQRGPACPPYSGLLGRKQEKHTAPRDATHGGAA